jgi:acetylornithine deacetylase/succinyl-diaminopimelate desuccinylase-like protein
MRTTLSTFVRVVPIGAAVALLLAGCSPGARGASDEAVSRLQEYLRIDTTNPPGNETRGAEFFARIFEAEGVAYEIAESAPGRGNIRARLEGGPEPALILLHHMDVVPADSEYWSTDPLSGERRDGYVWGRGAQDTKTLGILHLETFLALKRAGRPLTRPVIFMATADEEAGGFQGVGWLVQNRPAWFEGAGFLLNEGGGGTATGGRPIFEVEVTQKVPLWLRVTARDQPGHGSTPRPATAVTRLIRVLERLRTHAFQARVVPAVETYLRGRAAAGIAPFADRFAEPAAAAAEDGFVDRVQAENTYLAAILRNTCTITRLEGSSKINVVPPAAHAEIDCRLLPDQDPDTVIEQLRTLFDDPAIEIETLMAFSPAVSRTDTDLFRAIERVTKAHFRDAVILPSVQSGFTDSHFTRDLGITSYGFAPVLTAPKDAAGVHGNDERVTVENVRRGVRMMREIVEAIVYQTGRV